MDCKHCREYFKSPLRGCTAHLCGECDCPGCQGLCDCRRKTNEQLKVVKTGKDKR